MSDQAKWTKGKWRFVPGVDNVGDVDLVHGSIKAKIKYEDGCSSDYHLARIWDDGPNPEADAHLMAAAPDLYAALADLAAPDMEALMIGGVSHKGCDRSPCSWCKARRALSRARGETP